MTKANLISITTVHVYDSFHMQLTFILIPLKYDCFDAMDC